MRYVSLAGNWLREALLELKPAKESRRRFLGRCANRLQQQASLDRQLIDMALATGAKVVVPLFAVAVLAREVGCSVERLLFGEDGPSSDDPNDLTPADASEIASANNFATVLEAFHVDFPSILWEYAFPAHRKGEASEISVSGWLALYVERSGQEPAPRSNDG